MSAGGPPLLPITLSIIARDEERDLPAAVESAPFASEVVVVVDSASLDRTGEVARALDRPGRPVRVIEKEWAGHVAQKNFALGESRAEWVLCLDADERVGDGLRAEIEELFRRGPAADGYTVGRRTFYLGRWMRRGGWYPDRKLRLARRERARWEGEDPHDSLKVEGRVEALRGDLEHLSYHDLSDQLRKMDRYTSMAARRKLARRVRHPLLRMLVHPPARFLKMALLCGGFREGLPGMIAAGMGALYVFLKYAKLWELIQEERRHPARGEGTGRLPAPPAQRAAGRPPQAIPGGAP